MSCFIVIRGPLGVGKSTIAKKLASELNGEYVDIDRILDENGLDKVSEDEGCIPAENFIKADNLILPELKKKLQNNQPVIFDACFYHKKHIEHLINSLPFPHYAFTLKAPVDVCIRRDSERSKTHGEGAAQAVHYLVSRFDYGTIIDTNNKTIDETFREILKHIPKKSS
ncbi:ATP-binding protein [Patescibacteria group bacterium]|nr:ATP-binding protein [Patescibacteria group bacterium]MBU1016359.1 ATP-binding protein [Patescibacteria group bacterium]MBU1684653.1 ATP-binding protein [Patescibacteria group bacterium]MBU1938429.1 ATP-binding protein [Patescibacteria group bacterium]